MRKAPADPLREDREQNLAVVTAAAHFGVTAVRDEYPAARVTTLRLPAPYRLARGKRNPIAAWLDGLGLFGKRGYEKFVPKAGFRAPNDQLALFLRHLWATDGSVRWDARWEGAGSTTPQPGGGLRTISSVTCFGSVSTESSAHKSGVPRLLACA